ncbi:uncharacterized protein LOC119072444 [Bradysia coprophila]|uniref:uncharacterized protein LOC119072444 n=1 Tax=Bradysia coprophila TaxID=38358 RepID=UPI00187D7ED2|nr:uncharacterized protein LOC119072444 [Bradysia coprophila]
MSEIKKHTTVRPLSKQQKNAFDYWNGATNQLEKTSLSVLDLFRRNNDGKNFTIYQNQYEDFKRMRNTLIQDVTNAIQSNNLKHMEGVITDAMKKLKDKVYLHHATQSETNELRSSLSEEYDEALMALKHCMEQVRKKLQVVDKCLNRLSVEMTLLSAIGKELRSLMKATVEAKKERRENVASTVIALAPEVMSYIQTQ